MIKCRHKELKERIIAFLEGHNIFVRNIQQSESVRDCIRITIGTREEMEVVLSVFDLFCK